MGHPPDDTLGQQDGRDAVDGRVRLTQDQRQLRRFDEGSLAENVEQLSVGERHSPYAASYGDAAVLIDAGGCRPRSERLVAPESETLQPRLGLVPIGVQGGPFRGCFVFPISSLSSGPGCSHSESPWLPSLLPRTTPHGRR